jgi:peroxiredoxin
MKITALIGALIITQQVYSQGCFEKCRDHLSAPLQSNENLQMRFEQSANVLQNLIGCRAPEFNVTSMKGEALNSKDLRGKIVVMNFWFESCEPCIKDLPALDQLAKEYQGRDVVFIAFSRDPKVQIKKFLTEKTFGFEVVPSEYDVSENFCVIGGWPMQVIIDKKGIVRYIDAPGLSKVASHSTSQAIKTVIDENLAGAVVK